MHSVSEMCLLAKGSTQWMQSMKCSVWLSEVGSCVSLLCLLVWCPQDTLDRIAPDSAPYRHTDEGSDDMPAHVKWVAMQMLYRSLFAAGWLVADQQVVRYLKIGQCC